MIEFKKEVLMKKHKIVWLAVVLLLSLFILAKGQQAFGQEILLGNWKGEWYSYTRGETYKMEIEFISLSPLSGNMYRSPKIQGKPRWHYASVTGEVRDGKDFLEFFGPDVSRWNFELTLKGNILDGDGKTHSGQFSGNANLRLEKTS